MAEALGVALRLAPGREGVDVQQVPPPLWCFEGRDENKKWMVSFWYVFLIGWGFVGVYGVWGGEY